VKIYHLNDLLPVSNSLVIVLSSKNLENIHYSFYQHFYLNNIYLSKLEWYRENFTRAKYI
jgi:hypothetical protein